MGVVSYDSELVSTVAPARLFKGFVLDVDNLVPKLLPQAVKSVEVVEGDGGAGTVKLITFGEGNPFKNAKDRIDAIDSEKLTYSHSIIDGDILMGVVDKISYDIRVEASADGGSIAKATTTYYTKADAQLTDDQINDAKVRLGGMFKTIEAYLVANPSYN